MGLNVKVDAVAGSGKTTSVLHTARELQGKRVLLLTYNARLKRECRAKQDALGLHNLEVHSYHSLGVKYYSPAAMDDAGLRQVVDKDKLKGKGKIHFDLVVVDEAQDMAPLYCEFLHKVLQDNTASGEPQLLVIGDHRQCIYDYKGADERHLTLPHKGVFASQREWKQLRLGTSYRLTGNMATFINAVVLGHNW